jgi:hypothetical protein
MAKKIKQNGKAAQAKPTLSLVDSAAQAKPTLSLEDAVRQGKALVAQIDRNWMELVELADEIKRQLGKKSYKLFLEVVAISDCTIERHRNVYKAWAEKPAPGPVPYAVARELQKHPDRFEIIKLKPDLTKRAAAKIMREWRDPDQDDGDQPSKKGKWNVKETRRWFKDLVERAARAIEDGPAIDKVDPAVLRQAIEPTAFVTIIKGSEAWFNLVERLHLLFMEKQEQAEQEQVEAPKQVEAPEQQSEPEQAPAD